MGRKTDIDPEDFAQVNVRMTREFKAECDAIAEQEGISLNEWIRRAMRDRLFLANGKDITADVVELPPIYREIVDNMISQHVNELKKTVENLQSQITEIKNTPLLNDVGLRHTTLKLLAEKYYGVYKKKYPECSILRCGVCYNNRRADDEGVVEIGIENKDGGVERIKRLVSSDEINQEILRHGREIFLLDVETDMDIAVPIQKL